MTLEQINHTSNLIKAATLIGATYRTEGPVEKLRLACGREASILTKDEHWHFYPLWTTALPLWVPVETAPDKIAGQLIVWLGKVRGPIKNN